MADLPPLSALRAFWAFSDTGSVTRAGERLNVTHAAISQQIRALEAHLDVALVDRRTRRLVLTSEGRQLAEVLARGFRDISDVIDSLTGAEAARPIHVSTTPSFASFWLMPRLAGFRQSHPDIDIRIDPTTDVIDLRSERVDVAIRYGSGRWAGLDSLPLVTSPVVVVGSPKLLQDQRIETPEDLLSLPWLIENGTDETNGWLRDQKVTEARMRGVTRVPGHLLLMGAVAGQGVAATVRLFVEDHLRDGSLVELFRDPAQKGYHLVTTPGVHRPALKAFLHWIRRQNG